MTWGKFKLAVLQKIFSNEGAALNEDDTNEEYVNAMPHALNEAVHILTTRGKPLRRKLLIAGSAEEESPAIVGSVLTVPLPCEAADIELGEYITDVLRVREDMLTMLDGTDAEAACIDQTALRLWAREPFRLEVWYDRAPKKLTTLTENDEELDFSDEIAVPAVLYVASELYKEDDIQLSTQWRNQFEVELESLQDRRLPTQRTVRKTRGWY